MGLIHMATTCGAAGCGHSLAPPLLLLMMMVAEVPSSTEALDNGLGLTPPLGYNACVVTAG